MEIVTYNAPPGSVTMGYRLRVGGVTGSRVTAGITETPAGSGVFVATVAQAPPFTAIWDDGAGHYAVEDVRSDLPSVAAAVWADAAGYPDGSKGAELRGAAEATTVVVSPVLATANNPRHTTRDLAPIYAGSAPADVWTVVDSLKQPVDLTDKSIRMVAALPAPGRPPCDPFAATFSPAMTFASTSVGGEDGNVVTVQYDAGQTAAPGDYTYWLLNLTDRVVLVTGKLPVKPIAAGAWG